MKRWAWALTAALAGATLAFFAGVYAGHVVRDFAGRSPQFRGDEVVVIHAVTSLIGSAVAGTGCFWLAYHRRPPAP